MYWHTGLIILGVCAVVFAMFSCAGHPGGL
jgi:hypothetical protein